VATKVKLCAFYKSYTLTQAVWHTTYSYLSRRSRRTSPQWPAWLFDIKKTEPYGVEHKLPSANRCYLVAYRRNFIRSQLVCVCARACEGNRIHFLVPRLQMKRVVLSSPSHYVTRGPVKKCALQIGGKTEITSDPSTSAITETAGEARIRNYSLYSSYKYSYLLNRLLWLWRTLTGTTVSQKLTYQKAKVLHTAVIARTIRPRWRVTVPLDIQSYRRQRLLTDKSFWTQICLCVAF
jgi:hypothetical protein